MLFGTDGPLRLIRSLEQHGSDLLKVEFIKVSSASLRLCDRTQQSADVSLLLQADPGGPHFQTQFDNTEQTLKVGERFRSQTSSWDQTW